jgi:ATP-dependent exoDNAse (exonuclease V) beta subunit
MWWIAPAFLGEVGSRLIAGDRGVVVREEGEWRSAISYAVVGPGRDQVEARAANGKPDASATPDLGSAPPQRDPAPDSQPGQPSREPVPEPESAPPVTQLSYSSLGEYGRCGYRFYLERVLGLPRGRESRRSGGDGGLSGAERGVLVHGLLEELDFGRPIRPSASAVAAVAARAGLAPSAIETAELQDLVERFAASELCARIAAALDVRREERFSFLLEPGGVPVTGILDVVAQEADRLLVVDYKSDRLEGAVPAMIVEREYGTQRLVYALAALAAGAAGVELVHVFLERPDEPVSALFGRDDSALLERDLAAAASGVLSWDFGVSDAPCRELCAGCPGEGGLCSWPLDMTRREAADRLF